MTTLDVEKFLEKWIPSVGWEDCQKDLSALIAKAKAEALRKAAEYFHCDIVPDDTEADLLAMADEIEKEAGDGR